MGRWGCNIFALTTAVVLAAEAQRFNSMNNKTQNIPELVGLHVLQWNPPKHTFLRAGPVPSGEGQAGLKLWEASRLSFDRPLPGKPPNIPACPPSESIFSHLLTRYGLLYKTPLYKTVEGVFKPC
jgi:hypothetical protein